MCRKAGVQKNGAQKLFCVSCRKYQQANYKYQCCKTGVSKMISTLVCESVSIRGISRILGISLNSAVSNIKKIAATIEKPAVPMNRKSFEMDEIRTYIGNKDNQYWVAYALCSHTKEVVDFIVGKRNKRTLRMVVNTLLASNVKIIKTDRLNIYRSLIPSGMHIANAYNINHIERNNLNVRHILSV
jgi:insertion element IS1 protein InsB